MKTSHFAAVILIASVSSLVVGCGNKSDDAGTTPQATSVATPPPPATTPDPPASTPPPPPPPPPVAPRPVTPAVAPANTTAACRQKAIVACTTSCDAKVNEKTHNEPNKRRIAHDICFAECTRASVNICR